MKILFKPTRQLTKAPGGPLFNFKGEVIGVNTAIIAPGQSGSIGIGFAIPANAASNVINQLKFEKLKRMVRVRIQEVTKEIAEVEKLKKPEGALVTSRKIVRQIKLE